MAYISVTCRSPTRLSTSVSDTVILEEPEADDIAGFIMFECGLEDISIKIAKRGGYKGQPSQDGEEDQEKLHKAQEKQESRVPICCVLLSSAMSI